MFLGKKILKLNLNSEKNKNILGTSEAENGYFFKNAQPGLEKCGSYIKKKCMVFGQRNPSSAVHLYFLVTRLRGKVQIRKTIDSFGKIRGTDMCVQMSAFRRLRSDVCDQMSDV